MTGPAIPVAHRALGIGFGALIGALGGLASILLLAVLFAALQFVTGLPHLGGDWFEIGEGTRLFAFVVGGIAAIACGWRASLWYWRSWRRDHAA